MWLWLNPQGLPEVLTGTPVSAFTKRYTPPFDEFEVDHILVPVGKSTEVETTGPSILLVFDGIGVITQGDTQNVIGVKKGDVLFVAAGQTIELAATLEVNEDAPQTQMPLQLYRAGVNTCLYHSQLAETWSGQLTTPI